MLGVGVFVGLSVATILAGSGVIGALTLAAVIASLNSIGEAQLAVPWSNQSDFQSKFPLQPIWLEFMTDWALFLGRLTTTATALLGLAGYLLNSLHQTEPFWLVPTAIVNLVFLAIAATQRLTVKQFSYLGVTVGGIALLSLIGLGFPQVLQANQFPVDWAAPNGKFLPIPFLQATALMTVAYAGCESLLPQPILASIQQSLKATSLTIGLIWMLLFSVAIVSISTVGTTVLGSAVQAHAAPLTVVMRQLAFPGGVILITLGAVATLAATVLTLLPKLADRLVLFTQPTDRSATWQMQRASMMLSPKAAWILVTVTIGCITLVGDIQLLWSFSAVLLLIHYALVHLRALQYRQIRLYQRWLNGISLGCCIFLIFWLDWTIWLVCLGLVALGVLWYGMTQWSEEEE